MMKKLIVSMVALILLVSGCSGGSGKPVIMLDACLDSEIDQSNEYVQSYVFNQNVVDELEKQLKSAGYTVKKTKELNDKLTVMQRAEIIEDEDVDLVISISTSYDQGDAKQIRVLVEPPTQPGHEMSVKVGTNIANKFEGYDVFLGYRYFEEIRNNTFNQIHKPVDDLNDYGIPTLTLMMNTKAPLVTVELLSINSLEDIEEKTNPDNIKRYAQNIVTAINDAYASE